MTLVKQKTNSKNMNELIKAKEILYKFRESHMSSLVEHKNDSFKYFDNRGFVTFKTQDCAYFVKQIYNKSIRDHVDGNIVDRIVRRITGFFRKQEETSEKKETPKVGKLSAMDKFKKTSFNIIKEKSQNTEKKYEKTLQDRIDEYGESEFINKKASFLKQVIFEDIDTTKPVDPKQIFQIKRGIRPSDVNWTFQKKSSIGRGLNALIIAFIVLVIPAVTYYLSVWSGSEGTKITLNTDNTWKPTILSNGLPIVCTLVDTGAFSIIDKVFDKKRFYKNQTRHAFKFITYNAYTLSSNLFYQIYGFVKGTDSALLKKSPDAMKFELSKSVIDATTMSIVSVIIAAILSMIIPIVQYYMGKLKKPIEHDITFGFSNANVLLFNLGFYASINPNAIFVVMACITVFYYLESWMFTKGIIVPQKNAPNI